MLLTALESKLETHDLAVPIPWGNQKLYSPVLVLTSGSMNEADLPTTKARIEQFAAATKGQVCVIALVLEDETDGQTCLHGLEAFMKLQALFVFPMHCPPASLQCDLQLLKSFREQHLMSYSACFRRLVSPYDIERLSERNTSSSKSSANSANVNKPDCSGYYRFPSKTTVPA